MIDRPWRVPMALGAIVALALIGGLNVVLAYRDGWPWAPLNIIAAGLCFSAAWQWVRVLRS